MLLINTSRQEKGDAIKVLKILSEYFDPKIINQISKTYPDIKFDFPYNCYHNKISTECFVENKNRIRSLALHYRMEELVFNSKFVWSTYNNFLFEKVLYKYLPDDIYTTQLLILREETIINKQNNSHLKLKIRGPINTNIILNYLYFDCKNNLKSIKFLSFEEEINKKSIINYSEIYNSYIKYIYEIILKNPGVKLSGEDFRIKKLLTFM